MKILFLAHRIPYPPNKGDKIRSFYIMKYFSQKHSVYLACLADEKNDLKYKKNLLKYCTKVEVAFINKLWINCKMFFYLITGHPLSLAYFGSRYLQKIINKWLILENFDMVYVYSSSVAQYVIDAKGIYKVMDYVDVDSDKWLQNAQYFRFPISLIYKIEGNRMKKYEQFIATNFHRCIFVAERDQSLFQSFVPNVDALTIPNGVNLEYFSNNHIISCESKNLNIVFTGAMNYFANVDGILYFHREIYPKIKQKIPGVKFYIVGSNPTEAIKNLEKDKSIIVTGRVKDIRPYLQEAMLYVAPLRISRGVQNKILEAMAMGLTLVTTTKVLEGILKAVPGRDLFVEDNPTRFAQTVIGLLTDAILRDKTGKAGRKFVEKNYSWNNTFEKLKNLLEEIDTKMEGKS